MIDTLSSATSVATASRGKLVDMLAIGFPDAVTCLWCLCVWMHPLAFGPEAVKCVVLMMLMEFILLNTTGLFTVIPFMLMFGRRLRMAMLLALCVLYLALIASFAHQFHAIWPYFVFAWMVAGKVAWMVRNRRVSSAEQMWLMGTWAVSVVAYLGAVGIGATQSIPQLGITASVVPLLHLPGGGEWMETPHRAVASAVFYFLAVAVYKWMYLVVRRHREGRRLPGESDAAGENTFHTA